jgi:hypothetical protein
MAKAKKETPYVEKAVQETVMTRYRLDRTWNVYTTNHSDICLFKRRGWKPVEGKEAEAALPYLIFRIPLNKVSIRSNTKRKTKR